MAAYLEESNIILPKHLYHATKSLNHSDIKVQRPYRLAPVTAGIGLILFVFSASAYFYMQHANTNVTTEPMTGVSGEKTLMPVELKKEAVSLYAYSAPGENDKERMKESAIENGEMQINETDPLDSDFVPGESDEECIEESAIKNGEMQISYNEQLSDMKLVSVKAYVANIRKNPSVDSKRLGQTYRSHQFIVINEFIDSQNTKWYQIPFQGEKGWISGWLVERVVLEEVFEEESELIK